MTTYLHKLPSIGLVGVILVTAAPVIGQEVNEAWLNRFNGEINGSVEDDGGFSIQIDSVGNSNSINK